MKKHQNTIDQICYKIFIKLIGIVGLLCMVLISWISFLWSIGCFIHLEIKEGIIALLVCLLSIVFWKGSEQLYEKLKIE
jgi:hypothetical protein